MKTLKRIALRSVLVYLIVCAAWILISDALLAALVTDPALATKISILKGWLFVAVTGVMLYALLSREMSRWAIEAAARRRVGVALAASERRLANALTMARAGHWEYDVAADRFTLNDHFYAVCRTTAAREGGYSISSARFAERFIPPSSREAIAAEVRQVMAATDPNYTHEQELPVIFGDGVLGKVIARVYIVKDEHGRTIKACGVVQDVTKRASSLAALADAQALYRSLVENIPAGVFRKDAAGRYVLVNERFCQIEGWPAEKFLGRTAREVADELAKTGVPGRREWQQTIHQAYRGSEHHVQLMRGGPPIVMDEEWVLTDGEHRYFQAVKTPVRGANGEIVGSQGMLFDVTMQRRTLSALQLFRALVDSSSDSLEIIDPDTARFLDVNETSCKQLGCSREEHLALRLPDIDRTVTMATWLKIVAMLRASGTFQGSGRHRRRDGTEFPIEFRARLVRLDRDYIVTVVRDTSERERLATDAGLHEQRLRAFFGGATAGMALLDCELRYIQINETLAAMNGLPAAAHLGRTVEEAVPHLAATIVPHLRQVLETGRPIPALEISSETPLQPGVVRYWTESLFPIFGPDGRTEGVGVMMVETTERKHAEAELRKRSRAIEQSPVAIMITDHAGAIEYVNPRFVEISGYAAAEVIGRNPRFLKSGHTPPLQYRMMWSTIRSGREWHGDFCNRRKNGELYWVHSSISPLLDEQGRVTHFVAVKEDITARRQADLALRASEERLREVVESIAEVFWVSDAKSLGVQYVSPAFERVWCRTRADILQSRTLWRDSIHPDDRERVLHNLLERQCRGEYDETYRIRQPSGEIRWIHDKAFPVKDETGQVQRVVGVAEDITERRVLEGQLRRAQRLEAIGALSSGIAHDLNNILAPILMAPSLLRGTVRTEHERQLLTLIEQSARRGSDVIKQLLTFSRGSGGERVPLQMRHLLKEMRAIVAETFPRDITLQLEAPNNLLLVLGDATQFHQVMLNLCVNARDAMPAGGTLTLAAQNVMIDAERALPHPHARPGPHVEITVKDTGHGIPAEISERIFDPFFTTKEPGKGTGLGLSTVLGIVRSHGGFIEVESEPGKGATFRVVLPVAPSEQAQAPAAMTTTPPAGHGELVLVVDDEAMICEATGATLASFGYRVLTAKNGAEALALARDRLDQIALVLTDIMMPGMNGATLIAELRRLRPNIKVLATTGMMADSNRADLAALDIMAILPKPCSMQELLEAVARELTAAK